MIKTLAITVKVFEQVKCLIAKWSSENSISCVQIFEKENQGVCIGIGVCNKDLHISVYFCLLDDNKILD